jgi:gliding motility-associated lipoprotein GldJ
MNKLQSYLVLSLGAVMFLSACKTERSGTTGWEYNNSKNGGFEKPPYIEQETGPGLVLIEGGSFTMGRVIDDVMYDWNATPRKVTVSSFYMDETEVRNLDYLEYLYWLNRTYIDYPEVYYKALPDTLVWRDRLAYNEPYVEYYLRHPAYRDYPVVGVSWLQAKDYCDWRTDRVNELIMVREGLFQWYTAASNDDNFNTDAYLAGQYESQKDAPGLPNYNPSGEQYRRVKMEDGIFLPKYRLPTEAEWEFAAYGLIGNTFGERIIEKKQWPWNGHGVRNSDEIYIGEILANFRRGRGDNMGVSGRLNDNADITAPVYSYWPNDYGLYNMAGNVSEWVLDVYRPLSFEDVTDFRPFRGNVFQTLERDEEGQIAEKDSLGKLKWRNVDPEKDNLTERLNYRYADNINYLDGDDKSNIFYGEGENIKDEDYAGGKRLMYQYSTSTLINDQARVYKGGNWKDQAFYLNPGTRRHLQERFATDYLGFRCAMTRVGSPVGLGGM